MNPYFQPFFDVSGEVHAKQYGKIKKEDISYELFGFINGYSRALQILVALNKWTSIIGNNGPIDCI